MSVYVDHPEWPFGRMKMCHMMADTHEELLAMADLIGVARKWIQHEGRRTEHFDICKTKRALAIAHGAQVSDLKEVLRRKRGGEREERTP